MSDILDYYIKHSNDFDGIALSSEDSYSLLNKNYYSHPNLMISNADFGFDRQCFPINKNNQLFRIDFDKELIQLHNTDNIENICKVYREPSLVKLCVL